MFIFTKNSNMAPLENLNLYRRVQLVFSRKKIILNFTNISLRFIFEKFFFKIFLNATQA